MFLFSRYALGLKEDIVLDEIKIYIPQIISWGEKHIHKGLYTFGEKSRKEGDLSVIGVKDIEENVWSPRFGIKGKIDVTVDVKVLLYNFLSRLFKYYVHKIFQIKKINMYKLILYLYGPRNALACNSYLPKHPS
jgi:hypothetical protein